MTSRSKKSRIGAPPKFSVSDARKIRTAYGKCNGRGRPSTKGVTLAQLAVSWGASISTIRQIVLQIGAYAPKQAAA